MKKFLAILIAALMVMSMATVAFATEMPTDRYTDTETVTVTKLYKLKNAGTLSPEETFSLKQVGSGTVTEGEATEVPDLVAISTAHFDRGDASVGGTAVTITITLPEYERVGVYTYTLCEVDNGTAGVTYHTGDIKLVVTVIEQDGKIRVAAVHTEEGANGTKEDGTKRDTFENTYSAGSLTVSKTVDGLMGDKNKYFEFSVTFTSDKEVKSDVAVNGLSDYLSFTKNGDAWTATANFGLKHGETITFSNLPYGVRYTVSEQADTDYNAEINGQSATMTKDGYYTTSGTVDSNNMVASYKNIRDGRPDTGVSLDTLPYVLVLALVGAGLVLTIARKRRVED